MKMKRIARKLLNCLRVCRADFQSRFWNGKETETEAVGIEESERILENYSPNPRGNWMASNIVAENPEYDLQIIVPAYNVEKYVRKCIDSILNQKTKYSYIVYIIDDGSTDSTPGILDSYAGVSNVNIIHQENRGFSGARNRGLQFINAKYIMFVDSDDFLAEEAIETLMNEATNNNADLVQGEYRCYFNDNTKIKPNTERAKGKRIKTAVGNLDGFAWGKVFKNHLFQNIIFPERYWYEDTVLSFLIYPQSKITVIVDKCVYYYRKNNANSITVTGIKKPKCIDTLYVTQLMMQAYDVLKLPVNKTYVEKIYKQMVLNYKRTKNVPETVQQAIFCVSKDLALQFLPIDKQITQYTGLTRAFHTGNFRQYQSYMKLL